MPTGYTSKLYHGKEITFQQFVLDCARAFGACVTMRDDPADAPIPERFEPTPYYADALVRVRAELAEVEAWTNKQAEAAAIVKYDKAVEDWNRLRLEREARRHRYESMLAQVRAWQPPTSDHQGLKDFMIEQLVKSIDFDCDESRRPQPDLTKGAAYKEKVLAQLRHDLAHYEEEERKERERVENRNRWIAELRASLGNGQG